MAGLILIGVLCLRGVAGEPEQTRLCGGRQTDETWIRFGHCCYNSTVSKIFQLFECLLRVPFFVTFLCSFLLLDRPINSTRYREEQNRTDQNRTASRCLLLFVCYYQLWKHIRARADYLMNPVKEREFSTWWASRVCCFQLLAWLFVA